MRIREFRDTDIPRLKELFAQQGFTYSQPDWEKMFGKVLVDDRGTARILFLSRPTVENYAVVDQGDWAAPGMKMTQIERLDKTVIEDLRQRGYTDQHSWVPPQKRAFLRRLMRFFGWVKSAGPDNWTGIVRHI